MDGAEGLDHGRSVAGVRSPLVPALRLRRLQPPAGGVDHRGLRPAPCDAPRHTPGRRGGRAVNLVMVGCDFRSAPVDVRERLAFDDAKVDRALDELVARYDCEAVIVSTCNRVELFLARAPQQPAPTVELIAE